MIAFSFHLISLAYQRNKSRACSDIEALALQDQPDYTFQWLI